MFCGCAWAQAQEMSRHENLTLPSGEEVAQSGGDKSALRLILADFKDDFLHGANIARHPGCGQGAISEG